LNASIPPESYRANPRADDYPHGDPHSDVIGRCAYGGSQCYAKTDTACCHFHRTVPFLSASYSTDSGRRVRQTDTIKYRPKSRLSRAACRH
jgi:hypothetical protein